MNEIYKKKIGSFLKVIAYCCFLVVFFYFFIYEETLTETLKNIIRTIATIFMVFILVNDKNSLLKKVIFSLFICLISYLSTQLIKKIDHKKKVEHLIQKMPAFFYQNSNGKTFTNDDLKPNTSTVFFYYNSECDFCNHEAKMVQENIDKFKNSQLVFVSFEKSNNIKAFAQQYKLDGYDNVAFVSDTRLSFATTFDVKSLPAIVIYDKNNKLVQKLKGQTKPEKILEFLK